MCRGPSPGEASRHDQGREPHQEVRRHHRRRRHLLHGQDRSRHRFPRSQRRRQVHHAADHGRPDPAHLRLRHRQRAAVLRPAQPGRRGRRPARRLGPARRAHRPRDPDHRPAHDGPPGPSGRGDAGPGRADPQRVRATGPQLLPRHAAAARHRDRPDRRPRRAGPRRARQRARPRRDPLDARPAARLREPGRDRPALLAPAARDRGRRRRHRRDRQRPDRRPGHQGRAAAQRRHPGPLHRPRPARARARRLRDRRHRGR